MTGEATILVLGEDGVGKSSLINALVTEEFDEKVPARLEEVTISADITPEGVATRIVDFSREEQDNEDLYSELQRADVVCLVYDLSNPTSLKMVETYWMPLVRQKFSPKPVVLVGNKVDRALTGSQAALDKVLDDYPEIETCIQCSAKLLEKVSEVFYHAQKAVLHPRLPLYDPDAKTLTGPCLKALQRIFRICDMDSDGILSDQELSDFQNHVFKNPLSRSGLLEVQRQVTRNRPEGISTKGINFEGFTYLHESFIERGRQETTWVTLRKFGYDQTLALPLDYLCPPIDCPPDCLIELSSMALDFLADLFQRYDKDRDEALSYEELEDLFSLCSGCPWTYADLQASCTTPDGLLTLDGFIGLFVIATYLDYKATQQLLAILGYHKGEASSLATAFQVIPKKQTARSKLKRSVYSCYVFGPTGVGKTSFLQSFLGRTNQEMNPVITYPSLVASCTSCGSQEMFLVLQEIPWSDSEQCVRSGGFDVACFLYDVTDPGSFDMTARMHQMVPSGSLTMIVGVKSDLPAVTQDTNISPTEYCERHCSAPFQKFSTSMKIRNAKVFSYLTTLAGTGKRIDSSYTGRPSLFGVSAFLLVLTLVGFLAYRHFRGGPRS